MNDAKTPRSSIIDMEKYEKMTLREKWVYLNEKSREIHARVEKLID